jgi:hypothetical protein
MRPYADAKSYHIESVEERTTSNDLERNWEKTILSATESPGDRYRYEGHSGFLGGALRISDGKTVWTFHFEEKSYTAKPFAAEEPRSSSRAEYALNHARTLRQSLATLAQRYKFATQLRDDTLSSGSREVFCYVIRVRNVDLKRTVLEGSSEGEKTFWIDKAHETIVKVVEHLHTYVDTIIPIEEESTTVYTVTELDGAVDQSLFAFRPPSEAKLVENFKDPNKRDLPDLTGRTVPPLKLGSADGKMISMDSFRGKPVLLNLWATWCPPCLKELPEFA